MSQENIELARRASHAWNEGGIEAVLPFLDPDVEWHPPRESMEPGIYRGHAGVRDYSGRLGEVFDQRRVEPVEVIDVDAERVISVIQVIGRREKFGTDIDAVWAWLVTLGGGKIIEVRIYTDRAQALDAAGLRE